MLQFLIQEAYYVALDTPKSTNNIANRIIELAASARETYGMAIITKY